MASLDEPPKGVIKEHKFAASFTLDSVDEPNGVIKGVAVITEGEVQGHNDFTTGKPIYVDAITVQQIMDAALTYETGLKVNADHGSGVFACVGYLNNFRIEGASLRADMNILDSEENRGKLFEMARDIPDAFGLSVAFSGEDEIQGNKIVARCSEIYSCDIVGEPAANPTGLFDRRRLDARRKSNMAAAPTSPPAKQGEPANKGEPTNTPLPSPQDILTQCSQAMTAIQGHLSRFAELEAAVAKLKPAEPQGDPNKTNEPPNKDGASAAAAKEPNVSYDAKFDERMKEFETRVIAGIAKEFTAKIGVSAVVVAAPGAATDKAPDAGEIGAKFGPAVQKHFSKMKNKQRALSAAISEVGQADYEAFIRSGKRIQYEVAA